MSKNKPRYWTISNVEFSSDYVDIWHKEGMGDPEYFDMAIKEVRFNKFLEKPSVKTYISKHGYVGLKIAYKDESNVLDIKP